MVLKRLGTVPDIDGNVVPSSPVLELEDLPMPTPGDDEILVRVSACGVCHTELDEIEGRTPPAFLPMVLGHQVVGSVAATGKRVSRHREGDRVGIGWIHSSSGDDAENLSTQFRATGRDAPGGYAEYMTVGERYAYPIPEFFSDHAAAPLLCAGGVGYRALKLAGLEDGQTLGLTGFGGSAHLVLQLAKHLYPRSSILVFARDVESQKFAVDLGADWAGSTTDRAPQLADAIIDTTPAWLPVVEALANLAPGGRLVINAIRKEDGDKARLADLSYESHLWMEKEVKTVANVTARDLREFLPLAADCRLEPEIRTFDLADANRALSELKHTHVRGAKVLRVGAG
jgi:propanol-preferring alcohol dehydrogenase